MDNFWKQLGRSKIGRGLLTAAFVLNGAAIKFIPSNSEQKVAPASPAAVSMNVGVGTVELGQSTAEAAKSKFNVIDGQYFVSVEPVEFPVGFDHEKFSHMKYFGMQPKENDEVTLVATALDNTFGINNRQGLLLSIDGYLRDPYSNYILEFSGDANNDPLASTITSLAVNQSSDVAYVANNGTIGFGGTDWDHGRVNLIPLQTQSVENVEVRQMNNTFDILVADGASNYVLRTPSLPGAGGPSNRYDVLVRGAVNLRTVGVADANQFDPIVVVGTYDKGRNTYLFRQVITEVTKRGKSKIVRQTLSAALPVKGARATAASPDGQTVVGIYDGNQGFLVRGYDFYKLGPIEPISVNNRGMGVAIQKGNQNVLYMLNM